MTRKFFFLTKILEEKVKKKRKSCLYVCAFYFTFLKSINIESKSKVITIKKQLAKAFLLISREFYGFRHTHSFVLLSLGDCRDFLRFERNLLAGNHGNVVEI